jgi:hypothetical protein
VLSVQDVAEVLPGSFKQGIAVLTRRTGVNTGQQGQYVKRSHRIKCFSGVNDQPLLVCPASGQSAAVGLFRNGVLVVASEVSQLALVRLLFYVLSADFHRDHFRVGQPI